MKEFYDEVNFYQSLNLFNSWAAITMKYLVYHNEKKHYIRGQVVYKQNEIADYFYIIRSGEFQMVCRVPLAEETEMKKNEKDHFKRKTRAIPLRV